MKPKRAKIIDSDHEGEKEEEEQEAADIANREAEEGAAGTKDHGLPDSSDDEGVRREGDGEK